MIYKLGPRLGFCFLLLSVVLVARDDPFERYVGFYAIVGEKPKEFVEFANFAIISLDAEHVEGRVVPSHGRVYEFSSAKLVKGDFRFRTRPLRGLEYEFTGRFLKPPPFPHDGRTPILEGILKRVRNGEVIAESKCQFAAVEAGDE